MDLRHPRLQFAKLRHLQYLHRRFAGDPCGRGHHYSKHGQYEFGLGPARQSIFDRLYLGGSNNLRGFKFRDIGPKDTNGQPIGGKTMARATVEISFPIIEKARGAVFYDCGFVNPDAWDFSPGTIDIPRGNNTIATTLFNQFGVPTGNSGQIDPVTGIRAPPPASASLVNM